MNRHSWIILCLAYIVSLLSTNLFAFSSSGFTGQQLIWLVAGLISLSAIAVLADNDFGSKPPRLNALEIFKRAYKQWLGTAIVAILAIVYFQVRIPQPQGNDISYQVTASDSEFVTVSGKVLTEPRLNDSQRLKFVFKASRVGDKEQVSGKLYATLPLLQGTGIYPGQNLKLKGSLYLPQAAKTPSGFDFKQYLARQGVFAGIQGFEAVFSEQTEPSWGWWKLRRRIVRSQLKGLGSPMGQLVSSMILGRKAVDLPVDIRDRFIEAGLAHVLAASGFHVSLLLGIILKITNRLAAKPRLVIGIGTLLVYLGLTGIQASVFRACLMGVAVLIALVVETKVKPLGSLLLAATIILLFNPLFISDLGFQLSFLATFGLIVTMPGLIAKLDWLPPTLATLVAVPLAATVWVLPLLSYQFNSVATYSIIVNIICTPLITVISLGGMVSAIAALIMPLVGSAIAWVLLYPTLLLMAVINFFTNLPGSSWAIGQISLGVLLTIYGLFLLVLVSNWWRKHLRLVLLGVLTLIIVPVIYQHFNLTQITVLPAHPEPIIVIQDRGKVVLVNTGEPKDIKYSLLPFLTNQGVNQINYAISSPGFKSNWSAISERLSIKNFVSNPNSKPLSTPFSNQTVQFEPVIATKSLTMSFDTQLSILKLDTAMNTWLILNNTKPDTYQLQQYIQASSNQKPLILVGTKIVAAWLKLQPQSIIASNQPQAITRRDTDKIQVYNLQDGVVHWTPDDGIEPLVADANW
ncbi:ComEC/Rec2 family competence protein [Pleurocapsa sp. FMAR1]|uniref:ComEC/Rec2 family competence protein n=1 Tax=Pleurocapsa sp. FMAR1 TaxID=3040204 RepID=UPI0029C95440|nr:ComEC/Rec2 family competence protein [Pleurocapsa sp. FMAR1]